LAREGIVARARVEIGKLLLDILRALPRQRRRRRIAAGRSTVAPRAISDGKIFGASRCREQRAAQDDEDREICAATFHRFPSTPLIPLAEQNSALPQCANKRGDRFDL
jgi:hypothetical protein